ncbi:MAG TPA: zinc ribbon domain-containing protein [Nocardioides sp.]|uniref:zinc ribbon domain-containing protein n=1 Tax=Nocardioides sp. TaxID=35761 RepID=UPI002C433B07|nr:zinc ribbon domain-containing protein [Nocardioides sp.]HTW15258.1 zinc ribbon domain-containing protein [Nocardioides sp.]
MTTCTRCGHQIEVGRFCTNCGSALESDGPGATRPGPTDTAERPAVRPSASPVPPPPPLPPAPTTARFPLFADEVSGDAPPPSPPTPTPAPTPAPAPEEPAHRGRTNWLVWGTLAAVLVVVALVGATLLLVGNGDDTADDTADDPAAAASSTPPDDDAEAPAEESPEAPDTEATPPTGEPVEVAGAASAQVPATAPPGTDVDGTRIRYGAAKLLDGDASTCWRMTGDGTGREIVLTLAEPTTLTELGLVNGYAKTAQDARGRPLDWYAGNRRVLRVEWQLDDGTVVPQDLAETREMQTLPIDPVETSTVVLRLVEVSEPGRGRAARDNTAIGEISIVGTPAG